MCRATGPGGAEAAKSAREAALDQIWATLNRRRTRRRCTEAPVKASQGAVGSAAERGSAANRRLRVPEASPRRSPQRLSAAEFIGNTLARTAKMTDAQNTPHWTAGGLPRTVPSSFAGGSPPRGKTPPRQPCPPGRPLVMPGTAGGRGPRAGRGSRRAQAGPRYPGTAASAAPQYNSFAPTDAPPGPQRASDDAHRAGGGQPDEERDRTRRRPQRRHGRHPQTCPPDVLNDRLKEQDGRPLTIEEKRHHVKSDVADRCSMEGGAWGVANLSNHNVTTNKNGKHFGAPAERRGGRLLLCIVAACTVSMLHLHHVILRTRKVRGARHAATGPTPSSPRRRRGGVLPRLHIIGCPSLVSPHKSRWGFPMKGNWLRPQFV